MQWQSFQLNLPVTPITDLIIRHNNLIVATSGRSFWILDDLGLLRQYGNTTGDFTIYQPEETFLVNGSSELDKTSKAVPDCGQGFKGSH